MAVSLIGNAMSVHSATALSPASLRRPAAESHAAFPVTRAMFDELMAVSYTHLTLPTIYSV